MVLELRYVGERRLRSPMDENSGTMWDEIRGDLRRHGLRGSGFWALLVYRYGRWSQERNSAPARWCASKLYGVWKPVMQLFTGIDLDRTTQIGHDLHIVHGGMIHIHPQTVIGDRVGIMHGVTIGTNMAEGAPQIGNDVFIGCHASVLGGIKIGDRARIAANSLVIADVPEGAVAIGVPARIVPDLGALRKDVVRPVRVTNDVPPTPAAASGKIDGG